MGTTVGAVSARSGYTHDNYAAETLRMARTALEQGMLALEEDAQTLPKNDRKVCLNFAEGKRAEILEMLNKARPRSGEELETFRRAFVTRLLDFGDQSWRVCSPGSSEQMDRIDAQIAQTGRPKIFQFSSREDLAKCLGENSVFDELPQLKNEIMTVSSVFADTKKFDPEIPTTLKLALSSYQADLNQGVAVFEHALHKCGKQVPRETKQPNGLPEGAKKVLEDAAVWMR